MKIFLSAVSAQFESCRKALRSDLSATGVEVKTQEDFQQGGGTLLEKLEGYINSCDRVIALVGDAYGAEPHEKARPTDSTRRSYTQWEYAFATGERLNDVCDEPKQIFLYLASPEFLSQHSVPQTSDRIELQQAFVETLYQSGRDYNRFGSIHELRALVLRGLGNPSPQPLLTHNTLEPSIDNRFVYRSRQIPFVGREKEKALLNEFLAASENFQWLVVSGPGGAGKSRLVQEFCFSLGDRWQAGFLSPGQAFDWMSWKPSTDTMIVIDYAAERVNETKGLLLNLASRPDNSLKHKVRIVLVERDGEGEWLNQIIGSRSDGYVMESARYSVSPIHLGPLNTESLWEVIKSVTGGTTISGYNRAELMEQMHDLDPAGRPMYAIFAADSIAAGRNIREWNKEKLMRDVLIRERQGWKNSGITTPYENLLAFATLCGGLREEILQNPPPGLEVPSYNEFDRVLYGVMTGCDPTGKDLPGLKPDLLGEFFVLDHVKGRNEIITQRKGENLCAAAWKTIGSHMQSKFRIDEVSPSKFILFLERLIEDFIEDPRTVFSLYKPTEPNVKLFFWHNLLAIAIKTYLDIGYLDKAKALYETLSSVDDKELHNFDAQQFVIKAAFSLLPYALNNEIAIDKSELLERARNFVFAPSATRFTLYAFGDGASNAVKLLYKKAGATFSQDLARDQEKLILKRPNDEYMCAHYADTLFSILWQEPDLVLKQETFDKLELFLQMHRQQERLYRVFSTAAVVLQGEYLKEECFSDVERMHHTISSLLPQFLEIEASNIAAYSVTTTPETVDPAIVQMRRAVRKVIEHGLATSCASVIYSLIGTMERYDEVEDLLNQVKEIWLSYSEVSEFTPVYLDSIKFSSDAWAAVGMFEKIPEALTSIDAVNSRFPRDNGFTKYGPLVAASGLKGALLAKNIVFAEEMFLVLEKYANRWPPDDDAVVGYAVGAIGLMDFYDYQESDKWLKHVRAAAWAFRSKEFRQYCLTIEPEENVEGLLSWLSEIVEMEEISPETGERSY